MSETSQHSRQPAAKPQPSAVPFVPHQSAAKAHASLRRSLNAMDQAHRCAVLWFGEIMNRHLYRDLGYATINQYAMQELGFSKSRTGDFIRLARKLDDLPAVREAVATGELGYTKAREIVSVATAETEKRWLAAAQGTRRELVRKVKKARRAARIDPRQRELLAEAAPVVGPQELPVRFSLDLTPEQEARRSALVERLHKLGGVPTDRAELLLEALAALIEAKEEEAGADLAEGETKKTPRGALVCRPPVQIHVYEDAATGKMTIQTDAGERVLGRADSERLRCDATVCGQGGRNKATIAPRVRRQVLARDRYRCSVSGCGRTRFLEVHHIVPRQRGGSNHPENLLTLCSSCHRLWHEQIGGAAMKLVERVQTGAAPAEL